MANLVHGSTSLTVPSTWVRCGRGLLSHQTGPSAWRLPQKRSFAPAQAHNGAFHRPSTGHGDPEQWAKSTATAGLLWKPFGKLLQGRGREGRTGSWEICAPG